MKKVVVIGGGFGGIATACLLGKKGFDVTIVEKNEQLGGRARVFEKDGFVFDMGPSWYMMPDIFEHFFNLMGEKVSDHLSLSRLAPSYRIFLKSDKKHYDFYSDLTHLHETFESIEKGSSEKLKTYMAQTKYQYEIARDEFMFKNYDTIFDFFNKRVLTQGRKLPLFSKVDKIIDKLFKSEILRKVMKYQTVLLGTAPGDAPGIYSLMNYVDFVQGVWYPDGGIYKVVEAMEKIALKHGVTVRTHAAVKSISIENGVTKGVVLESGEFIAADIVVSNADIVHTDQSLLAPEYRQKSASYWDKRLMAPSAFILYLGVKGELPTLQHHNLIFTEHWNENFDQIFKHPAWPHDPSLYICCPSKTDANVAPAGHENLFVLVPIASGLQASETELQSYKEKILTDMSNILSIPDLKERIVYDKIYCVADFAADYNAFKGTALGLAHSLSQTAIFRPNNVHRKVSGLYFVGAGTNPGIGMPICLISAELVYKRILGINDAGPLTSLE